MNRRRKRLIHRCGWLDSRPVMHLATRDCMRNYFDLKRSWVSWYAVPVRPGASDARIADSIHEDMVWDPFVDADHVRVEVRGGHATLTGQVRSQHERIAATEAAYEGGAVAVDNRLTLSNGV